nr:MAG TPA: hypothetical protein [Caudoviricetes sp.]
MTMLQVLESINLIVLYMNIRLIMKKLDIGILKVLG